MRLIDGWLPPTLVVLSVVLGALSARLISLDTLRRHGIKVVAVAAAATAVLYVVVHSIHGLIADAQDDYPRWLDACMFVTLCFIGVAIARWRNTTVARRAVLVAAPLVMLLTTLDQVAVYYGFPPDVATLVGAEVEGSKVFDPSDFRTDTSVVSGSGTMSNASHRPTAAAPAAASETSAAPASAGPSGSAPTNAAPIGAAATTAVSSQPEGMVLREVIIPGTRSGFKARPAYVYLPAEFFTTPRPQLPVMVMLAGVPGEPKNLLQGLPAVEAMRAAANSTPGHAPILVFADYNGSLTADLGCIDSPHGNVETYLTKDVPEFIRTTFGASSDPRHWGIGGFSQGATCSLMIGLRHPEAYTAIASLSGDPVPTFSGGGGYTQQFLGGDASKLPLYAPRDLLQDGNPRPQTRLYIEAGEQEGPRLNVARKLARLADEAGLPTTLKIMPGRHNFSFWTTCMDDWSPWIIAVLNGAAPSDVPLSSTP